MYENNYRSKSLANPNYVDPSVIFYKPSPLVAEEKSMAAVALAGLALAAKVAACACTCTSVRGFEKSSD